MPKSKRARKVTLSKTSKRATHDRKQAMIDEVRACAEKFSTLYVLGVANMRNVALQRVRSQLSSSRIFFGRTKLLSSALGRTPSEEHRDGLHQVSQALHGEGESGLLFTNVPLEEVQKVLTEAQLDEFARAGAPATEAVELPAGPLPQFPHNMEPYLRKLGLPTRLDNGVVTLRYNHAICREGATLNSDQAKVLRLLGIRMATFKLTLRCRWTSDGHFEPMDAMA